MTPKRRRYEQEAVIIGHMEGDYCYVCGEQFTLAELSDSHRVPNTSEIVHARCCDHCGFDGAA